MIKFENFHPMKGHVEEGQRILMPSGEVVVLRGSSRGWDIMINGEYITSCDGAYAVDCYLQRLFFEGFDPWHVEK